MKKIVIYVLILVWFGGCMGSRLGSELPKWYLNSPNNNQNLYGVGEGVDLKSAKAVALNDMASRLSVAVDSKYEQTKMATATSYNKNVKEQINLEVKKINFTNSKVVNSTVRGQKTYILMSVNRQELFNKIQGELQSEDSTIKNIEYHSQNHSSLERMLTLKSMLPQIKKAILKVNILKVLKTNFDSSSYLNRYAKIPVEIDEINRNLAFSIKNSLHELYQNEVASQIAKSGYKVSEKSDLVIELKVDESHQKSKGWNVYTHRITVYLKDRKGDTLAYIYSRSVQVKSKRQKDIYGEAWIPADIRWKVTEVTFEISGDMAGLFGLSEKNDVLTIKED